MVDFRASLFVHCGRQSERAKLSYALRGANRRLLHGSGSERSSDDEVMRSASMSMLTGPVMRAKAVVSLRLEMKIASHIVRGAIRFDSGEASKVRLPHRLDRVPYPI
jgi:hypothetical protein